MTNRDRLIKALWLCEDVPYAVYREVVHHHLCCPYVYEIETENGFCEKDMEGYYQNAKEMCIQCKEDWLSQELDFELQGVDSGETV